MFYTFAAKVIADERILGTFGDFARKLGTTVCARIHDPQIFDGYIDPDILVFGIRTKETERYRNGEAEGLWYYSSDKQHLQEVRKMVSEFLRRMENEANLSAIVSDVYEFTGTVLPSQVSSISIPKLPLRIGMRERSLENQPQPSEVCTAS
jgi:hypothetical protein